MILVRAVRADSEDELLGQLVASSRRGHRGGGNLPELPDVDSVRYQRRARRGGIVTADLGEAGPAGRRHRGRPPERHPGYRSHRRLAEPVAREAHIALDRAVMNRHHERARPDERSERRVRDVQDGRIDRTDQPGELPAPMLREYRGSVPIKSAYAGSPDSGKICS